VSKTWDQPCGLVFARSSATRRISREYPLVGFRIPSRVGEHQLRVSLKRLRRGKVVCDMRRLLDLLVSVAHAEREPHILAVDGAVVVIDRVEPVAFLRIEVIANPLSIGIGLALIPPNSQGLDLAKAFGTVLALPVAHPARMHHDVRDRAAAVSSCAALLTGGVGVQATGHLPQVLSFRQLGVALGAHAVSTLVFGDGRLAVVVVAGFRLQLLARDAIVLHRRDAVVVVVCFLAALV